ncbi:putative glycolipid-binding domain-containing protein [Corynebacterium sp.]|uniref:putative glycolipid-binding domain-containing protein n=1 Tax=Corynebacterium sp. TaxID=1720 RepID=UPI0026DD6A39|nr:putative glycolipid-binding domain-containing protein [Corynebacterium sp.]MDO5032142.1 putative glycolipid-binding domain-containing protein [Corynebacterium sp.]
MDRYTWHSLIDNDQSDEATITFYDQGLTATGVQTTRSYRLHWSLKAPEAWTTRRFSATVEGDGWARRLDLERSESGRWHCDTALSGTQPQELAQPGFDDARELLDARDIDLGRCPMTNTMPIRRLGLLEKEVPRTKLIMAWIDVPSLHVIASDQYYASHDTHSVRYESCTRGVNVLLTVNSAGVVTHYPDLAECV